MNKFMELAIAEAKKGIKLEHGGPFGAIIVKNGEVVGCGHNRVLKNCDPTCHGEIMAIKNACKNLSSIDLKNCEIYTTGEPCPMCLSAILWSNIDKVYFGANIKDNEKIGFRDNVFDKLLGGRKNLPNDFMVQIDRAECLELFESYNSIKNKKSY